MKNVIFLNSFLLCPQKKNIGNIRLVIYLTYLISKYSEDQLESLKQYSGLTIKPNEVADFFGLGIHAVRKLMGQDVAWLEDACWLSNCGKIEKCFRSINCIRYKGYYIEIENGFLNEILTHLNEARTIDSHKFGEIDSVYSLVLYGYLSTSNEGLISLTLDGLKRIFDIEDCYSNSNTLYKKCIKEPCEKLNNIFKTNFVSKKIPLGVGDFIWVIGDEVVVSPLSI